MSATAAAVAPQWVESLDGQNIDGVPVQRPLWTRVLSDYVSSLDVGPWGTDAASTVAAMSSNGELAVLAAESGEVVASAHAHGTGGIGARFSASGSLVVTHGQDGAVAAFASDTLAPRWSVAAERTGGMIPWAAHVDVSRRSSLIAASVGRQVIVLNEAGERVANFGPFPSTVSGVRWHPSDDTLVVAAYGGLWRHELRRPEPLKHYAWKMAPTALSIQPQGAWLAAGSQDSTVHVWDASSGEDLAMSGYDAKIKELAWSPNGALLATGGGRNITAWSFAGKGPAGSKPLVGRGHVDAVAALAFHPNGSLLGSCGRDGAVFQWRIEKKSLAPVAVGLRGVSVTACVWTDRALVASYATGHVVAWPIL